jgi:DNA primase
MKQWINFREVKDSATMEHAMSRYAVQLKDAGPGIIRGRCPLPMHESDSATSFSVDIRRNIWACHSASCVAARAGRIGGNVLDFVALMEGCSIREAGILLQGVRVRSNLINAPTPPVQRSRRIAKNPPLAFRLKPLIEQHSYLVERGVDASLASHFGIGYFGGPGVLSGRIAIPIHNSSGQLVAYAGRAVDGSEPKYLFPAGFRKSAELFNLHRARATESDELIVVEGFFDCIRVHQAGFPNAVALMGCTITPQQVDHLCDYSLRVVLLLDGDPAGRHASPVISCKLEARGLSVKTLRLPEARQPDSMLLLDLQMLVDPAPDEKGRHRV